MPLYLYFPFLYFPKNKMEYIPAAVSMFFFMVAAVLFFYFIKKISDRQAQEAWKFERNLPSTMEQENNQKQE